MLSFDVGKSAAEVTHVAKGISVVIHSSYCLLFLFPFGPVLRTRPDHKHWKFLQAQDLRRHACDPLVKDQGLLKDRPDSIWLRMCGRWISLFPNNCVYVCPFWLASWHIIVFLLVYLYMPLVLQPLPPRGNLVAWVHPCRLTLVQCWGGGGVSN
jgi:hypothetical protein